MDFKNNNGSSSLPLARQGSIYSLTFEEFQNTLLGGSGLGSMNMDELLKSIWTAEESQALAASATGPTATAPGGAPLQRQGSLALPRTLSTKTVDEVWRDLGGQEAPQNGGGSDGTVGGGEFPQQRQATLGEMTLEEFLIRAGVVREEDNNQAAVQKPTVSSNGLFLTGAGGGIGYGALPLGTGEQGMRNGLMPLGGGGMSMAVVKPSVNVVNQMDVVGKGNGELVSPAQPVPYAFDGVLRGRRSGASTEKVVERRQKRMIKNRESAARSRARRQAYTMELEAEVAKLKQQNKELQKKQAELLEMQKNQVLEMINNPYGQKKRCLRRTLTGPW